MTPQMETAAQRYRRRKQEKAAESIETVNCPTCDEPWKVRRAAMEYWVATGIIPSSLAAVMMEAIKKKGMNEADIMSGLDLRQIAQSIEATSKIVRYTAVEPRIVETPTEPTDLGYDEVEMCCYNFLRDWQMTGGGRAGSLENFRQK